MKKILVPVLALILTACGAAAPQATVTSEVTVTLTPTVTPSFTATPTFTPTPTLTSDQQQMLDAANALLAGVWIIDNGGVVTDINGNAPEGIHYSVEEGLLTYTYMYEGKEITVDLAQNITAHPIEGCVVRFDAKCLTDEGKIAVVTYSSTGGYGYEGDGNPEHKDNIRLRSVIEQQLTLINPDVVNLKYRKFPRTDMYMERPNIVVKNIDGDVVFKEDPNGVYWGDNMIYLPDGNGGFTPVESTSFAIGNLEDSPNMTMTITYYESKAGTVEMMLSDMPLGFTFDEYMDVLDGKISPDVIYNDWSKWYDLESGREPNFR
jgi:hypothetical protein